MSFVKWIYIYPVCLLPLVSSTAIAQMTPYSRNRSSVVSLEITGRNESGQDVGTYGSGFIINKSGFVLTAAHVYDEIIRRGADKNTIKISAHVSDFTGAAINAVLVDRNAHDVAVLKLESRAGGYSFAKRVCSSGLEISSTKVYTSGFPYICTTFQPETKTCLIGRPRYVQSSGETGSIEDSQSATTFDVNLRFDYGASGSPVYLENGTIVGIAKGVVENSENLGVFIPISWAEGLLKGIPGMPDCSDITACLNSKVLNLSTEKFSKSGGARAGGPGPSSNAVTDTQNICYSAPPEYKIEGQVIATDNGNNGGRGSISSINYKTNPAGQVYEVCVTAKAWSEDKLFGAGGWQNVTINGIIKKVFSEQDLEKARLECISQN